MADATRRKLHFDGSSDGEGSVVSTSAGSGIGSRGHTFASYDMHAIASVVMHVVFQV